MLGAQQKQGLEARLMPIAEVATLGGCAWLNGAARVLLAPAAPPPSRAVLAAFGGAFRAMSEVIRAYAPDHVLNASLLANPAGGRA